MTEAQIINFIKTVPLFHAFTHDQLEGLAGDMQERDFAANELVIGPETEVKELYIVLEGEFAFTRIQSDMDIRKELARLYPGDHFGMLLVVASIAFDVTARAVTPAKALVLSRESFDRHFDESPGFARAVCQSLAEYAKGSIDNIAAVPFAQLDSFPHLKSCVPLIPPRICRLCQCLAVERDHDRVTVAMVDPSDTRSRVFVTDVLSTYHVNFVAVSDEDFQQHATLLLGTSDRTQSPDRPFDELAYIEATGKSIEINKGPTDDLLPIVISKAIRVDASDVHIEPATDGGRIRLRVDGRMATIEESIRNDKFHHLVNRLKVIAELDTTNIRRPQDGRFMVAADDRRIEFRVSATPCMGGEKIVLRLVAPHASLRRLDNLILNSGAAEFTRDVLETPSGLVLVTGPTGSGKTTTLYAALRMIESHDHTLNIVTIEDPVEYNLDFATQIQINRALDLDFANILRTVLRQDPDVILVGEIRDSESASIAVEAATTGHLVLSSLHTDSALDAIVRLRNLGVKPYLLANALKGVISQKLVPRLSPGCTEVVAHDAEIVQRMKQLGILDEDWNAELQQGIEVPDGPPGGESGRIGVFEILSVTDSLRDLIDRSAPLSEVEETLNPNCFCSFADYSRFLLGEGLVAPQRIDRIFPKR